MTSLNGKTLNLQKEIVIDKPIVVPKPETPEKESQTPKKSGRKLPKGSIWAAVGISCCAFKADNSIDRFLSVVSGQWSVVSGQYDNKLC